MVIRFEWDEAKSRSNRRKHGLSFEDAALVFRDPFRVSSLERIVEGEERWQTFGKVTAFLLVMVAHTVHDEPDSGEFVEIVRIISAREATSHERRLYEEGSR